MSFWKVLTKIKHLDPHESTPAPSTAWRFWDFTGQGLVYLGVGIFVVSSTVAKYTVGPGVVVSFAIAALAALLSGLCYVELGGRARRAGSAFLYVFVTYGGFLAFLISWSLILEYVIAAASISRAFTLYLDSAMNGALQEIFRDNLPIEAAFMGDFFDPIAFALIICVTIALRLGLKETRCGAKIISIINVIIAIVAVSAAGTGILYGKANWQLPPANETAQNLGEGGFLPFGVDSLFQGAAICFYAFLGFENIAVKGAKAEVRKNQSALIGFVASFLITVACFLAVSTLTTLALPYYTQETELFLPYAMGLTDQVALRWIFVISALASLCIALFYTITRPAGLLKELFEDALITKFRHSLICLGILAALIASVFDLHHLLKMLSIGSLLAFTAVSMSTIILRYRLDGSLEGHLSHQKPPENSGICKQIFGCTSESEPTEISEKTVAILVWIYCLFSILGGLSIIHLRKPIGDGEVWAIVLASLTGAFLAIIILLLLLQKQSSRALPFKVPLMPIIPACSIFLNIYLILHVDLYSWVRFGIWLLIGLPIYIFKNAKKPPEARNMSISSIAVLNNGTSSYLKNGYTNNGFTESLENIDVYLSSPETLRKKRKAPAPSAPSASSAPEENALEVLDEVIHQEEVEMQRKESLISNASYGSSREESVTAEVHKEDVPITPVEAPQEPNLLVKSAPEPEESEIPEETAEKVEKPEEILIEASRAEEEFPISNPEIPASPPPEKEEDVLGNIPTPPPFLHLSLDNTEFKLPRTSIRASALQNIKLKSPEIPPVDYSRKNSEDRPESLQFGTQQFQKFRETLNERFKNGAPLGLPLDRIPSKISTPQSKINVQKENVIEDGIDKQQAREKLKEYIQVRISVDGKNGDVEEIPKPKTPTPNFVNQFVINEAELKQKHQEKMKNVFGSIGKLKKADSFKDDLPNEDTQSQAGDLIVPRKINTEDQMQHRQNMATIFGSIRARRVDSFKNNENQIETQF